MSIARFACGAALLAAVPLCAHAQGKINLPVSQAELEKRVKTDSNDAAAHYNVALAYWNAHRWPDVDRELHAAIALDPRMATAHLALANLPYSRDTHIEQELADAGKDVSKELKATIEQSDREYRLAFVLDPMVDLRILATSVSSSASYADVKTVFGETYADYYQGRLDCFEGNYVDCESKYTNLINATRADVGRLKDQIYWFLGLAEAHNKHFDLAIQNFQLLVDRQEQATEKAEQKGLVHVPLRTNEYRYFVASFNHASGNLDAAIPLYQKVIENDIGLFMAHVRLADIYESRKDYAKAVEERRNAVNANPDDASLNRDLGVTLGKAGNFADAEQALVAATNGLPRDAEAWFWLGLAREQLGKKPEARAAYEKVVALAPSRLAARVAQAKQHLAALP